MNNYLNKNIKLLPHLNSPSRSELYISIELANKIINSFPEEDWSNPNLKFLEIASNNGIVAMIIALRLFNNEKMKQWQPDDTIRLNHILTNQIYAYTYTSSGTNITKKGLYNTTKVDGNVSQINFNNTKHKYDRIVCVPPRGTHKRQWPMYVEHAMNVCSDMGHVIHLINPNWRLKPDVELKIRRSMTNMFTLLRKYDIRTVEMNSWIDSSLRHDLVHVVKCDYSKKTFVKDCKLVEKVYNLSDMFILPNFNIDKINGLFTKNIKNRAVIYSGDDCDPRRKYMSSVKTKMHTYPCVNSIAKSEINYAYSSDPDKGHRNNKKVIFSNSTRIWNIVNDIKGEFAICNHAYGIGIDDDTDIKKLTEILISDKFNELLDAIKWDLREIEDYTLKLLHKDFYKML